MPLKPERVEIDEDDREDEEESSSAEFYDSANAETFSMRDLPVMSSGDDEKPRASFRFRHPFEHVSPELGIYVVITAGLLGSVAWAIRRCRRKTKTNVAHALLWQTSDSVPSSDRSMLPLNGKRVVVNEKYAPRLRARCCLLQPARLCLAEPGCWVSSALTASRHLQHARCMQPLAVSCDRFLQRKRKISCVQLEHSVHGICRGASQHDTLRAACLWRGSRLQSAWSAPGQAQHPRRTPSSQSCKLPEPQSWARPDWTLSPFQGLTRQRPARIPGTRGTPGDAC